MTHIDVFNGDADGLCALQQLRLAEPVVGRLVTGVKRDIALLKGVTADAGDRITVLDVSLDKNRDDLVRLLAAGAQVAYFDHHYPGEIPVHPALSTHIETLPDKGTSLIVDEVLGGRFRAWAVVGTFGDNFDGRAGEAAAPLGLDGRQLDQLRRLGVCLNYNGYGAQVADLHLAPDQLFLRLRPYADPLDFIAAEDVFPRLEAGYQQDMSQARGLKPVFADDHAAVYVLPARAWARRVGGVFANELARGQPGRAHALLTQRDAGGFVVSVRAPMNNKSGADELCRRFPTGGGRKAAAGINELPEDRFDAFVDAFRGQYP